MRRLPPQPSLEYLKKEAKELLRRLRGGEADDHKIQRWLPPVEAESDRATWWTLGVVQQALALSYGFSSWAALKTYIEAATGRAALDDLPPEVITQWQELVDTLARLLDMPAALLCRVAGDEVEALVSADAKDGPVAAAERARLAQQYCERVVRERGLQPSDASGSESAGDAEPGAYLGYPVLYPWGDAFATLCLLDRQPPYTADEQGLLAQLVRLVETHLALLHQASLLSWRNAQLESLFAEHHQVSALLRICSHCRKVANGEGWVPFEQFMGDTGTAVTHGICPSCFDAHYSESDEQEG